MTQPEPYTYTDPSDDTLTISRVNNVVRLEAEQDGDSTNIHVLIEDVDQVVSAIYTAAGRTPPRLDPIQECDTCHAGYTLGQPCATCAFNARMAAEQATRNL